MLYYGHRSGEGLRRSTLDGRGTVRIGPGGYRVCWRIASRGKPPEGTGEIFLPAQENAPVRFKDGQREDNSIHGFRSLARSRSPEGSAGSRFTENGYFRRRFFRGADQRRAAIRRRAATAAIVTRDVTNTRAGNGRSLNNRSPSRGVRRCDNGPPREGAAAFPLQRSTILPVAHRRDHNTVTHHTHGRTTQWPGKDARPTEN